jgi:hypothetical protein
LVEQRKKKWGVTPTSRNSVGQWSRLPREPTEVKLLWEFDRLNVSVALSGFVLLRQRVLVVPFAGWSDEQNR